MWKAGRRGFCAIALAFGCTVTVAQPYPSKPIRLVVGFAPGGVTDAVARVLASEVTKILGQPVIVENRSGTGGLAAIESVQRSTSDGHTLLLAGTEIVTEAARGEIRDLQAITPVAVIPYVLLSRPDSKYKSFRDLLGQPQSRIAATGHYSLVLGRRLARDTQGSLAVSPQQTFPEVAAAVTSGQTELALVPYFAARSLLRDQKARALATFSLPSGQLPQVPDARDAAIPPVPEAFLGLFVPAGTPSYISAELNRVFNAASKNPSVLDRFADLGIIARAGTPESLLKAVIDLAAMIPDTCKLKNECERDQNCPRPCPIS